MEAAMVSWREELARREAAAVEQVDHLRAEITELTERLAEAEQLLSRLAITRETMTEILGESGEVNDPDEESKEFQQQQVSSSTWRVGSLLVPQREPGMDAGAVLPEDYCEVLAVLAEVPSGLRAGQVAAELGIATTDRSAVESLRSKMKRLVARGWADQQPSGVFTIVKDAGVAGD